jgi:DNA replication protein DnaC
MSTCHFEQSTQFPDPDAKDQYEALMGLDEVKHRLETEAAMFVNPSALDEWSQKHHKTLLPAIELVKRRPPLIIFAGDVGTGKTALATSFGDPVARLRSRFSCRFSASKHAGQVPLAR